MYTHTEFASMTFQDYTGYSRTNVTFEHTAYVTSEQLWLCSDDVLLSYCACCVYSAVLCDDLSYVSVLAACELYVLVYVLY